MGSRTMWPAKLEWPGLQGLGRCMPVSSLSSLWPLSFASLPPGMDSGPPSYLRLYLYFFSLLVSAFPLSVSSSGPTAGPGPSSNGFCLQHIHHLSFPVLFLPLKKNVIFFCCVFKILVGFRRVLCCFTFASWSPSFMSLDGTSDIQQFALLRVDTEQP